LCPVDGGTGEISSLSYWKRCKMLLNPHPPITTKVHSYESVVAGVMNMSPQQLSTTPAHLCSMSNMRVYTALEYRVKRELASRLIISRLAVPGWVEFVCTLVNSFFQLQYTPKLLQNVSQTGNYVIVYICARPRATTQSGFNRRKQ
jgi:hypothetical protein